ncbi:hypothetical protein [Erwinia sorbitola]|uniref:TIGR02270 family protein n=1 Tax=Erwinia sorbitola TaxID=2681984 RepID=A0A6I6EXX9_9GAMM|nr:hypothetical protein [Erwinia sorbitola]MTD28507.1 hypothetical protein [Erwinia sorbitola]QGU86620.1 hypothetical protein GN242_05030 [Erwinia sorbitola]
MLTRSVNPILVEQYSDMHAVDFRRRRLLLESYQHDLNDLYQLDMRLFNYMRGLELLSGDAKSYLQEQLLSPLSVGDIFTIALFSVKTDNNELLEGCLTLAKVVSHFTPAIKSLIEWAPTESILWKQLDNHPHLKILAIYLRSEVSHVIELTESDIAYLHDKEEYAPLLIYALFYKNHPAAHDIAEGFLAIANPSVKVAIVDILLRYHFPVGIEKEEVIFPLMYTSPSDVVLKAVRLYTLNFHYSAAEYSTVVTPCKVGSRAYIQALGWSGYASNIPLLIDYLDDPKYCRLSAASITTITGSLPEKYGWNELSAESFLPPIVESSVIPDDDPDIALTWPNKVAFLRWWQKNAGRYEPGATYLNGVPVHNDGLLLVLRHGSLILRRLAAERLQNQKLSLTLNTDAPAFRQMTRRV